MDPLRITVAYQPDARLRPGDTVEHPKFGAGEVAELAGKYALVRFPAGEKKLVCGGPRTPVVAAPGPFYAHTIISVEPLGDVTVGSVSATGRAIARWGAETIELEPVARPSWPATWAPLEALRVRLLVTEAPAGWPAPPPIEPGPLLARYAEQIAATLAPCLRLVPAADPKASRRRGASPTSPRATVARAGGDEAAGETWPRCSACGAEPELLAELDLAHLGVFGALGGPGDGTGHLQVFVCLGCFPDPTCPPRFVPAGHARTKRAAPAELEATLLEAAPAWSLPYGFDGLPPGAYAAARLDEADGEYLDLRIDAVRAPRATWGTVGGHAYWEQEDATPICPHCQAPTKLLLFFDGASWLGDGNAKVFVCPPCGGPTAATLVLES